MKKTKLLGLTTLLLALGLAGCGEDTPKVDPCEKHTWGEYVTTKEATCKEAGSKERTCEVCGEKDTKEIAIKSTHSYVKDATASQDPTCNAAGTLVQKCSVCDKVDTQAVAKLEHSITTTATGKEGVSKLTCSKCSFEAYEFDISKATGWNKATTKWNAKTTTADNNQVEASWDVTGVIPNGKYSIDLECTMSYSSHSDRYFYNQYQTDSGENPDKASEAPYRYFFKVNDGDAINPTTTKNWGEIGFSGGDGATPKFGEVVNEVTINGATKFSVLHGDIGYSLIVSKVRLVKAA